VVAIENERLAAAICAALDRGGIQIRTRCRTGAEAIRTIKEMGGGTVICQFLLPDMSANELYDNLRGIASLLVAAKPQYLDLCESKEIRRLPLPASAADLVAQTERLIRIDEKRASAAVPKRSPEEQRLVDEAKALLMEKRGISEVAAHRYLQRRSMDSGLTMAETAKHVIDSLGRPRKF
jgi:response regulator NasT